MITHAKLEGRIDSFIQDGRIEMTDSGEGSLYLKETEHTPLDADQRQTELIISTPNGCSEIALSAHDTNRLYDALKRVVEDD
jgi:hypothetical protein